MEKSAQLCEVFGLAGPEHSAERVAMRVSQGGHDVPGDKLWSRFARTLDNLRVANSKLPHVLVFDKILHAAENETFGSMATLGRLAATNRPGPTCGAATARPAWASSGSRGTGYR